MNTSTRKTVSIVFLCFTIIWFAVILVFEARYLVSVFRQQRAFRDVLGTIYEEQIEGINFIILVVEREGILSICSIAGLKCLAWTNQARQSPTRDGWRVN